MDKPTLTLKNIDFTGMYDCFADDSFQLNPVYANATLDESIISFLIDNYIITTEFAEQMVSIMKEISGSVKVEAMEILWMTTKKTRQEGLWEIFSKQAESSGWSKM